MPQVLERKAQSRGELPLVTRAAPITSVDSDARTARLVWTTGAQVRRYDWLNDRVYLEELILEPAAVDLSRLQSGAPLLDSHAAYRGLDAVLGVVESAEINSAAREGTAVVRFSERAEVEPVFRDVRSGIIRNVSVGYAVTEWDRIPPSESRPLWVYRAVRWQPMEISLVPIGADAGAGVRSADEAKAAGLRMVPCTFNDFDFSNPAPAADLARKEQTAMTATSGTPAAATATQPNSSGQAPATDAAALEAARAEGIRAERERRSAIENLLRAPAVAALGAEFGRALLDDASVTVDAARAKILDKLASASDATAGRSAAYVETVADERDKFRDYAAEALLHRVQGGDKLSDGARHFRYMSMRQLAEHALRLAGQSTVGLPPMELIERSFHVSGDFANILANVANKRLRRQYDENAPSYTRWARRAANLPDFKPVTVAQLSNAPDLLRVPESGEIKFGSMTDKGITYQMLSYARGLTISRQSLINDDLSAFDRIAPAMGAAARRLENRLVYAQLTSNPTVEGSAAFAAGRNNLATTAASALQESSLVTMRANMRGQKGAQSEVLNLVPTWLIVPAALEQTAYKLTSSQYVPATVAAINEFRAGGRTALEPIVEAELDGNSATRWYAAADNAQIDTVEYAYLDGYEAPRISSNMPFDTQGLQMKVEHDFVAAMIDYRGLYRADGA